MGLGPSGHTSPLYPLDRTTEGPGALPPGDGPAGDADGAVRPSGRAGSGDRATNSPAAADISTGQALACSHPGRAPAPDTGSTASSYRATPAGASPESPRHCCPESGAGSLLLPWACTSLLPASHSITAGAAHHQPAASHPHPHAPAACYDLQEPADLSQHTPAPARPEPDDSLPAAQGARASTEAEPLSPTSAAAQKSPRLIHGGAGLASDPSGYSALG